MKIAKNSHICQLLEIAFREILESSVGSKPLDLFVHKHAPFSQTIPPITGHVFFHISYDNRKSYLVAFEKWTQYLQQRINHCMTERRAERPILPL